MDTEQAYRIVCQAWIDGVNEFHPAPQASYTLPWEEMPAWEREAVKALYHEVRALLLPGLQQGIRLPSEHGGYLVGALWNVFIFRLVPNPKPSSVKHFPALAEWQQKTFIKMFEAIETIVLQNPTGPA